MKKTEFSEAELKLVNYFDFDLEDIIDTNTSIGYLYRLMVDKSFRYNDNTVYSVALRKAWNEICDFKISRMTPEFDKIILDELGEFGEFELTRNIEQIGEENESYSPYCELCGGCGEDGCCSHLSCFRTLIKNPKCDYGITYLADAMFAEKMYNLGYNIIEKLRNHEITSDDAVAEYDKKYHIIWNEVYNDKYENLVI